MLKPFRVLLTAAAASAVLLAPTLQAAMPADAGLSVEQLARVDELVQRHVDAGSFTGAVVLIARDGRVAYRKAYGLMDLAANKPMVEDGVLRIMSMTKPVISVATLMMIEEGKVRLNDPISRFVPEWKDMAHAERPRAGGRSGVHERRVLLGRRRPVQHRDRLRAVRDDAGRRR